MTAARGGRTCEEDTTDSCGTDSYKASIPDIIPRQRATESDVLLHTTSHVHCDWIFV